MAKRIPRIILLIETSREHGRQLLRGITDYARLYGPWAFYSETGDRQASYPRLDRWQADGIIAHSARSCETLSVDLPHVCTFDHEHVAGIVGVSSDYRATGRAAAEYLCNRGLRHYAFCGWAQVHWSRERRRCFVEALEQRGQAVTVFDRPQSALQHSWGQEQERLGQWLLSLPKPVGLMACNDERGKHIIEACQAVDLRVPDDVAVIGVDNDELVCELCNPPLTSIALNHRHAGFEAAQALDRLMRRLPVEQPVIRNQVLGIVSRKSTHILATEDADVTAALRFILDHARENIQVADVAEAAGLSRRGLHTKFRAALGRTVGQEIARVRTEEIARMLVNTDLPIAQIARALGFPNVDHIARFFKRHRGQTPTTFRRDQRSLP
jgi:LacI family transcriptional regulator